MWLSLLVAQLVKNLRPGSDPWIGKSPWRRESLPTPVLWPGEFHGQYSLWGHKESDMTERLALSLSAFLGEGLVVAKTESCSGGQGLAQ